jgi:hypothetical protein
LDYSFSVPVYNQEGSIEGFYPFVGNMTEEEFTDFVNNGTIRTFNDYCRRGDHYEGTGKQRSYVVGRFAIKKENQTGRIR